MKINILECIKNKQAFKINNITAYYIRKEYIIKSYNTIIYSDFKGLDCKIYSHTTSKLQKMISQTFFDVDYTKAKRLKAVNGVDYQKIGV